MKEQDRDRGGKSHANQKTHTFSQTNPRQTVLPAGDAPAPAATSPAACAPHWDPTSSGQPFSQGSTLGFQSDLHTYTHRIAERKMGKDGKTTGCIYTRYDLKKCRLIINVETCLFLFSLQTMQIGVSFALIDFKQLNFLILCNEFIFLLDNTKTHI